MLCPLSILLKSYWNKSIAKGALKYCVSFNSSKVLLEQPTKPPFGFLLNLSILLKSYWNAKNRKKASGIDDKLSILLKSYWNTL